MALSGTLETFSLPDVLRLLASTKKSGMLQLSGDRGLGQVWVVDGAIVAAATASDGPVRRIESTDADSVDGAVFELLRFSEGTFEFQPGEEAETAGEPGDGEPREVEAALTAAETLLEEWREIEAVVPSLAVRVRLVPDVDREVSMTSEQWQLVAHIGDGRTGDALARALELGELTTCRRVRDLVELGLVEIDERAPQALPEAARVGPAFEPPAFASGTIGSPDWQPPARLEPTVATADDRDPDDGAHELAEVASEVDELVLPNDVPDDDVAEVEPAHTFVEATDEATDPVDAEGDDLLSQLANLSPKAAAAIEATAGPEDHGDRGDDSDADAFFRGLSAHGGDAETAAIAEDADPEGPTAAIEGAPAEDDVNQNLLLRFLSSTKQ